MGRGRVGGGKIEERIGSRELLDRIAKLCHTKSTYPSMGMSLLIKCRNHLKGGRTPLWGLVHYCRPTTYTTHKIKRSYFKLSGRGRHQEIPEGDKEEEVPLPTGHWCKFQIIVTATTLSPICTVNMHCSLYLPGGDN